MLLDVVREVGTLSRTQLDFSIRLDSLLDLQQPLELKRICSSEVVIKNFVGFALGFFTCGHRLLVDRELVLGEGLQTRLVSL